MAFIHGSDAFEQFGVERYAVLVLRKGGHEFLCQTFKLVTGFCAEEVSHYGGCTSEQLSGMCHGFEGVVECGRLGVVYDGFNLAVFVLHAFHKGGFEVFQTDFAEGYGI